MEQTILIGAILFGVTSLILFLTMINSFRIASKLEKIIRLNKPEPQQDLTEDLKKIEEIRKKIQAQTNVIRGY
jgi:ABC-type lipoprotein release transport system permease subunit